VAAWLSSSFKDVIAYLVLIGFLLVRPKGIFGEPIAEKV
jgi:branched-chain amino acid transport system permease protein